MKYKILTVLICFWCLSTTASAVIKVEKSFVRFQGRTVSVGDPLGHLVDAFGTPYHKEKKTNYIRLRRNHVVERDVFLWFYRLGGEYGGEIDDYKFIIYDGIVQKIIEID